MGKCENGNRKQWNEEDRGMVQVCLIEKGYLTQRECLRQTKGDLESSMMSIILL